jgi:hypothetical protein
MNATQTTTRATTAPAAMNAPAGDIFEQSNPAGTWKPYRLAWADTGQLIAVERCTSAQWAAQVFLKKHRGNMPADVIVSLHGEALAIITQAHGQRPEIISLPALRAAVAMMPQEVYQTYRTQAERAARGLEPVALYIAPDGIENIEADESEITPDPVEQENTEQKPKRKSRAKKAQPVDVEPVEMPAKDYFGNPIEA